MTGAKTSDPPHTFRVGIIGAGLMAGERAAALRELSGVAVSAIASRSIERADRLADEYAAERYADWRQMLEAGLDGIIVATPNHVHAEQAIAALEHGKHVLVEYPLAITMGDVERMFEVAEASNRVLAAGFNTLYPVRKIAERARCLGRPILAYHDGINQRPDDYGWYLKESVSGGMIVLWGIEQIASLCHLMGRVRSVSAFGTDSFFRPDGGHDSYTLALAFESGASASIQVTINAPATVRTLRIVYEDGIVDRQGGHPATIQMAGQEPTQLHLEGPSPTTADTSNWIAACRGHSSRFPSREDTLHFHQVAFAARQAAVTGQTVSLS